MDPLTAIGLASSIVQFVDYGTKLIGGAREIYYSTTGTTAENATLETVVKEIQFWSVRLRTPPSSVLSREEKGICTLAAECQQISQEILDLIHRIKLKRDKSRIDAFIAALKEKQHEKEKAELQGRLEKCRNQLAVQVEALDRLEFHLCTYLDELLFSFVVMLLMKS